jgi:hypothetical protein
LTLNKKGEIWKKKQDFPCRGRIRSLRDLRKKAKNYDKGKMLVQ